MAASDSGSSRADEEEDGEEEDELPSDSSRLSADIRHAAAGADEGEEQGGGGESSESSRSSSEALLPEHRRGDPSIIPWAQRIGVDPRKMHVMHASFFPRTESAAVEVLKPLEPDRTHLTPNGLHRKHSRDSVGDGARAMTREVCRPFCSFSESPSHALCASELPLPMMSNPSLSYPLVNMLEWRAPPQL